MLIHEPEIAITEGEICLSARIEPTVRIPHLPERLWYRFPETYQSYISARSDSFLLSLFLLAMYLGEELQVEGTVSPQLAHNMSTIQDTYLKTHSKQVRDLQRVQINYKKLQELSPTQAGKGVACAFSGGIDSSYVLYSNLINPTEANVKRLTHGIFVDGFDIFLHQPGTYRNLYRKYTHFFEQLGLELLTVHTNVYSFTQFRVDWTIAHDPALVGIALIFANLLKCFYKPGGNEFKQGKEVRASYTCVPLMSTESMQIILDHPHLTRLEKLEQMADWWGVQQNLRVCINPYKNADGSACYRCAKCLNTLTYLELLGVREKFTTFPQPFSLRTFLRFSLATNDYPSYYPDHPRYFKKYGRMDLYVLFFLLYIPMSLKPTLRKWIARWLRADWRYRLERWVYRGHWSRRKD